RDRTVTEFRRVLFRSHPVPLPYPLASDRVTMLLTLTTKDAVWKALPSERRNRVRKGEKNGLTAAWCGAEALDDFYRVFAVNMRRSEERRVGKEGSARK